ncbi:hypothetical protein SCALM49S_05049 [Streptomyces californicus]
MRGAQVPEHLGDLAASARVEGEDPPAGGGERTVAGVVLGGQGQGVGAVTQLQRRPVEIPDDGRMPRHQPPLFGGAQPGEELLHFAGRGALRIGAPPGVRSARHCALPGGGPVSACCASPETQPAVPATVPAASANATRALAYRRIVPSLSGSAPTGATGRKVGRGRVTRRHTGEPTAG